jgi:hypothetical protein
MTGRDVVLRCPGINPQTIQIPSACSIRAGGIFLSDESTNFLESLPHGFRMEANLLPYFLKRIATRPGLRQIT